MADYDWFDRETETAAEREAKPYRSQGFQPVFRRDSYTMGGRPIHLEYYLCRRGCGTMVWNPEDHMKNVCVTFDPVAGIERYENG